MVYAATVAAEGLQLMILKNAKYGYLPNPNNCLSTATTTGYSTPFTQSYLNKCATLVQFYTNTTGGTDWITPSLIWPERGFADWIDRGTQGAEHVYATKEGLQVRFKLDGSVDITVPQNVEIGTLLRMVPHARLLDRQGRVITFDEPNGVVALEALKNSTTRFIDIAHPTAKLKDSLAFCHFNKIAIPNTGCRLILPNDVQVKIDGQTGGITIDDADRKVFYEAAPRGFNKYLNASDTLEDFIRYLGRMDVRQRHVMAMPLGLYINWLIIEAAEKDGDTADDLKPKLTEGVASLKAQPRCLFCKRFIAQARHEKGINFCCSTHMDRYMAREDLLKLPKRSSRRRPVVQPPSVTYFDKAAA
jgi:hypothetical protein